MTLMIISRFADNGEFSHFEVHDKDPSTLIWSAEKHIWISVNDNLPTDTKRVLTYDGRFTRVAQYTTGYSLEYETDDDFDEIHNYYDSVEEKNGKMYLKAGWWEDVETPGNEYECQWNRLYNITHWMYLPEKPIV